jgi:hypothetical protein
MILMQKVGQPRLINGVLVLNCKNAEKHWISQKQHKEVDPLF